MSKDILFRQMRYYGHLARHPEETQHTVCFSNTNIGANVRALNGKRRAGKPRHHWIPQLEKHIYTHLRAKGYILHNRGTIFDLAKKEDGKIWLRECGAPARESTAAAAATVTAAAAV